MSALINKDFLRIGKKIKDNSLFLSVMNFLCSCRKLCFTSSVYDMYFCTKSQSCSCSIHCYVTTADNGNFLACCDRCIIRIIECFHQVASCQVFVCGEYAACVLSRDSHEHRKTCTGADEYSFKSFVLDQLVDGCGFTDDNVCFEFNAKFFDFFDFFLNDFLFWKTEFRDTINKNAAELMKSLEYSYIITCFCKISCTGKSGRTGTDNCNFVSILNFCSSWFDVMLQSVVSNESLQFTDGNSLALLTADTLSLTLGFLWTYTTADSRKSGR